MITIFGSEACTYCKAAKDLCDEARIAYQYIDVFEEEWAIEHVTEAIGPFKTVPQIFDGADYIGGFEQFREHMNT